MIDNNNKHTFIDDEGKEHEFEIIDLFEVEDIEYVVLQQTEEEEALLLRVEYDEKGEQVLAVIENQEEFNEIRDLYQQLIEED